MLLADQAKCHRRSGYSRVFIPLRITNPSQLIEVGSAKLKRLLKQQDHWLISISIILLPQIIYVPMVSNCKFNFLDSYVSYIQCRNTSPSQIRTLIQLILQKALVKRKFLILFQILFWFNYKQAGMILQRHIPIIFKSKAFFQRYGKSYKV